MSTRSFIAKQIGKDAYLTVYCHSDGYLTYNGALLLGCYNTCLLYTSDAADEL